MLEVTMLPNVVDHELNNQLGKQRAEAVDGPVIVGAGPSGMATAACLQACDIPYIILERSDCVASLWKKQTYDRLHLHAPKQTCALPGKPLSETYPTFLTGKQFVEYLEQYAQEFNIEPRFNETVLLAKFHERSQTWRVVTCRASCSNRLETHYIKYKTRWLIVATGENAEIVSPQLPGSFDFKGTVVHSSEYKNGSEYACKKVLVVGAGNSGMEIALDLTDSGANASVVVRSPLHVLPREMFGKSTFLLAMTLSKVLPVWLVDRLLVFCSQRALGDTSVHGLRRPKAGPLQLKDKTGKTPILDAGTWAKIQSGDITVRPAIDCLTATGARFSDGTTESYDAVILATGYRSAVRSWLKDEDGVFNDQGLPKSAPKSWKGRRGLYVAGLSGRGLLGATMDARQIVEDIKKAYFASK